MAGVIVFWRKDEQSAEPCLVVNAEAKTTSELDAEAYHQWVMQGLADDGSETVVGVAAGSSWYSKLGNKEGNGSSRETHVDAWRYGQQPVQDSQSCAVKLKCVDDRTCRT